MGAGQGSRAGHPAVFTADGPRGPVYKVKPGAVKLAQLTGYAIGIFYAHPQKAWMLRSWDRFLIPKPFSRVAISWGRDIEVPQTDDPLVIEAKRLEVEAALERARLNAERHFASGDEHAVAVGEEAITRFDRMTIGGERLIFPGKGTHQHQQRRLGQVKVGQQCADYIEAATRGEENIGCAGMRLQPADLRAVLQRPHRRRAGGNDAPALIRARLDLLGRFRGQGVPSVWSRISATSATRTGWNVPSPTWSVK